MLYLDHMTSFSISRSNLRIIWKARNEFQKMFKLLKTWWKVKHLLLKCFIFYYVFKTHLISKICPNVFLSGI